jgi:hypothetical protein
MVHIFGPKRPKMCFTGFIKIETDFLSPSTVKSFYIVYRGPTRKYSISFYHIEFIIITVNLEL